MYYYYPYYGFLYYQQYPNPYEVATKEQYDNRQLSAGTQHHTHHHHHHTGHTGHTTHM